ncbi:DUF58 domain-containing protein [Halopiger goleimassiliensis]|uniref:DUF58 domain-containing protein n=1 Tax=Halopiger goleimassiliensis TaxID=1293048 RepID=UPI000677B12D|nr:DUF58 domain-containing protein [Halopiger goleimassiliensis]
MTGRDVHRVDDGSWALVAAVTLAGLGIGLGNQVLVVAATLPLWYVAAAVFGTARSATVRLERALELDRPARSDDEDRLSGNPGDTVTVRTTVQNAGSEAITDLRVVDGVPEKLRVVSGTPRTCVSLEPLETATMEYEVRLQRGEYVFDDARVRTWDLTGTVTETWTAEVVGMDGIQCSPPVEEVPLGEATNDYAGEVPTDEGGSGVEFYSVRDYEPGDPVGAIDWRRYANTRDLATVEYRAERATRVVCLVDARSSQFRAATTESLPAAERSADAAERTVDALLEAGHPTGVVALQRNRIDSVPPGTDPTTRVRIEELLRTARGSNRTAKSWVRSRSSGTDLAAEVAATLPGEAQVYLFSSFVDETPVDLVEGLSTRGYEVRVVSPDVTDAEDLATRLEALDRQTRLANTRATGARVVDWDLDRPLGLVLHEAIEEVSHR